MRALKTQPLVASFLDDDIRTLIVGDIRRWTSAGRNTAADDLYHYVCFQSLSRELLADVAPAMVLSPLVSEDFDVIDLARHLSDLDYQGGYRVLTQQVPDARIILAEVALVAPDLDFDIFELPKDV